MDRSVVATLFATGFTVAFLHAAIPTHWLPFVLTGRVQRWSRGRTLLITAIAGTGHVLGTAILGGLVAWLGFVLSERTGVWFSWIAGGALVVVGAYFVAQHWRGHGHSHLFGGLRKHDHTGGEDHDCESHHPHPPPPRSDRAAVAGLFMLLTFSPCEGFIPIYASGARYGWQGFALLTAILSVGAVAAMVLFTALAQKGLERLRLRWLEQHENLVLGGLLAALGVLVVVLET